MWYLATLISHYKFKRGVEHYKSGLMMCLWLVNSKFWYCVIIFYIMLWIKTNSKFFLSCVDDFFITEDIFICKLLKNLANTFRKTRSLRDSCVRASWCRRVEGGTQRRLVEGALSFPETRACGPACLGLSVVVGRRALVLNSRPVTLIA